ncbi:organic solute transporter Ostalpha-domain-containing protein [Dissophora ornata]|nr:hypothetical protein BGZ58_002812 [Dissophora ornata]KAI8603334.1 organic solute transporter Ostalpha-domain-containing protein [Dissophora ornata]
MKFLCVKLVIFFCFWQTCLLSLLGDLNVFKATEYWSVSNIEIGISALLICVEMVVFAILHVYSFGYEPYVGTYNTPVRRSLRDGFNPIDLVKEIGWACKDIAFIIMGRPLPIRDEHLSGAVKRASIIRAKNRYSSKNGSFAGGNVTPSGADPLAMTMDSPSLEAGDKFNYSDPQQQAPLLSNVDNAHTTNSYRQNTYEMKQQQQQQQQQQLQHQQVQQQQLQHQQYQQQQQQLQQQQAYLSKPADDYQY